MIIGRWYISGNESVEIEVCSRVGDCIRGVLVWSCMEGVVGFRKFGVGVVGAVVVLAGVSVGALDQ